MSEGGVYSIRCTANDKQYIGIAKDFDDRMQTHFSSLQYGSHFCLELQADYDKYGAKAFEFLVMAKIQNQKQRYVAESKMINSFPTEKTYNKSHKHSTHKKGMFPVRVNISLQQEVMDYFIDEAKKSKIPACSLMRMALKHAKESGFNVKFKEQ